MLKQPPLVLDTTIISTFGKMSRFDILQSLYAGNCLVPTEVIVEATRIAKLRTSIQISLRMGWMEEHNINFTRYPRQVLLYAEHKKRFGDGEAAVMAVAQDLNGTVGSDDLRATVKHCQSHGIPLIGTLGILFHAYSVGVIDQPEGNEILTTMIKQGYKCPVSLFSEVVDWFQHGKGRRLF